MVKDFIDFIKKNIIFDVLLLLGLIYIWIIITISINRFQNPDKTETQLFLEIPKAFILDFK